MARLRRLDAELVRRGLARSRQHADELVAAGRVSVAGSTAGKSATQVDPAVAIVVAVDDDDPGYASRGIDPKTTPAVVSYGADTLVAGNAIFGKPDRAAAIKAIMDASR